MGQLLKADLLTLDDRGIQPLTHQQRRRSLRID